MSINAPDVDDIKEDAPKTKNQNVLERAALLDDDDDLSEIFLKTLYSIFLRFSEQARRISEEARSQLDVKKAERLTKDSRSTEEEGVRKCILTEDEFDEFTKAVNQGQVMSKKSKEEIKEYLDVDGDGHMTYAGFCEMYHLQTSSDPAETWKDLQTLGYNEQLSLLNGK